MAQTSMAAPVAIAASELCRASGQLVEAGRQAWLRGLVAGFSGNLSCRLGNGQILLTAAGSAKGRLTPEDLILLEKDGTFAQGAKKPSSEARLHLAIYAAFADCNAILHTHPACLQALELKIGQSENFLRVQLHEAEYWRPRLVFVPSMPPGSPGLGPACASSLRAAGPALPAAAWLGSHGLCALGKDIFECLAISEELEHLAKVQILSG